MPRQLVFFNLDLEALWARLLLYNTAQFLHFCAKPSFEVAEQSNRENGRDWRQLVQVLVRVMLRPVLQTSLSAPVMHLQCSCRPNPNIEA